ncbi:MAG: ATP-binding protein [Chthoniobacteraceae bacterium]
MSADSQASPPSTTTYELEWKYNPRLVTNHLGRSKYSSTVKALRELVANAFDAHATKVTVLLHSSELGEVLSITVQDNGHGISPEILRTRFMEVAVETSNSDPSRLGRFGVGRLAVHRIGAFSKWTTTSDGSNGDKVRCTFTIGDSPSALKVIQESAPAEEECGTFIEIFEIRDRDREKPTAPGISSDLTAHFCGYLLGNPRQEIWVQGERIDVTQRILSRELETIPAEGRIKENARLEHILFTSPLDQTRFPFQIIFAGKGRTVATEKLETPPTPNYLALVECPHLDSLVTANRELLVEMDDEFTQLRDAALGRIQRFGERFKSERVKTFIQRARQQEYYPYRSPTEDPLTSAKQAIYDVVLEKVHETANVESMTKRQQELVFRLLHRSLENEDVLEVLSEVARLSDDDFERFRKLLERTTLDSILKLSSEVSHRLDFLDVLHGLIYGDTKKHLKERSQLHRILEPDCWLFGAQFHLAASDRSFREVMRKHRAMAGLPDVADDDLAQLGGIDDIPDLFLASSRDYPFAPKHRHLLVELKAPNVSLGTKELSQIRRYADTILSSHEFDKSSTRWDLFLISGRCTGQIARDRQQKDKPHGCVWEWDAMTVWAFEWSEIIAKAKEEMMLVKDHLKRKSEELTVSQYLSENFPDILESLTKKFSSGADPASTGAPHTNEGVAAPSSVTAQ